MSGSLLSPPPREFASTEEAVSEIRTALRDSRRVLICGHVRPDGDCVGSMTAMYRYLCGQGKEARLFFHGPMQANLRGALPEGEGPADDFPADYAPDVTLCLDCGDAERISEDFSQKAQGAIVNIDHHHANTRFGRLNWVDPRFAAVGEMLCRLVEPDPGAWTPEIANALYLALMSDTGGFRFVNTTPETFRAAAMLAERGADPAAAATLVWGNRNIETVRIVAAVMNRMRFELGGRLVWSEITQETCRQHGGEENEPDNLGNELRTIEGVEVALLVRETREGTARGSMRSGEGGVDVSRIAASLGGGGHPAAAGFEVKEPFATARDRIVEAVIEGVRAQVGKRSEKG
ncbi:MAG TPA: DHH family phosphoesterase [Sumerlaeia bacterium]|nr:DHH family phosphoesterase [Sumerlaeia bacterium]